MTNISSILCLEHILKTIQTFCLLLFETLILLFKSPSSCIWGGSDLVKSQYVRSFILNGPHQPGPDLPQIQTLILPHEHCPCVMLTHVFYTSSRHNVHIHYCTRRAVNHYTFLVKSYTFLNLFMSHIYFYQSCFNRLMNLQCCCSWVRQVCQVLIITCLCVYSM